jgi:aminotransferase
MTRLANEHGAVNLAQGITDEPASFEMVWGGIAAALGGTDEGIEQLDSLSLEQICKLHKIDPELLLKKPLKDFLSRIQNTRDEYNQYSYPFGLPGLREAISEYTHRFYKFRPDPETNITVTLGATEGLSSVLRATCSSGDGIVIFQPFHEMYPAQSHIFGMCPKFVTLKENLDTNRWELDQDEFRRVVASGVRAIILNTPHNPTGKVFSREELEFICSLCLEHNLLLITDEIYEHILYGNHEHHCVATFEGMAERTLIVNAISKTGNATGWRVGWVISPEELTPRIRGIHDTLVIQAPTPLQKGVERLLNIDEKFYRGIRNTYIEKRDLLLESLTERGFGVVPPEGSYYLFANFKNVPAIQHLPPMDAAMLLINRIGVATVPGDNFYSEGQDGKNYLRFSFCRQLDTLSEAAERISKLN